MANRKYKNYKNDEPTSYSIAHYILVFLLVCVGVVAVIWILVAIGYRLEKRAASGPVTIMAAEENVVTTDDINALSPCAKRVVNSVAQIWTYSPDDVPRKYWDMAYTYVNDTIPTRTEGSCNNVRFICNAGQRRRDCDPCAVSAGMSMAMDRHISDMISQNCPNN